MINANKRYLAHMRAESLSQANDEIDTLKAEITRLRQQDAITRDSSYLNGFRAGWNLCQRLVRNDPTEITGYEEEDRAVNEEYTRIVESSQKLIRDGRRELKELQPPGGE